MFLRLCRPLSRFSLIRSFTSLRNAPLDIHPEVQEALHSKRPVVALETTLVSHGFAYPTNLDLALELENIVRSTGAVPATIGVFGGRVKVGVERSDLELLADRTRDPDVVKISRRDIAAALVSGANGGTTVSATLIFAALAGIKVFATGGLGGVHRGGEKSMDVSADLLELTRCPVGVVSSGVKSILDIGRTLEYLETAGVPVLSYSKTKDFPAFFTRRSGFYAPWNVDNPEAAARILRTQEHLQMANGALFAAPIPEEYEADGAAIQAAIDQAVRESEENGISRRGKEATPWLLARIAELTKGDSVKANVALLKNTALIGGEIAVAYSQLAHSMNDARHVNTPTPVSYATSKKTEVPQQTVKCGVAVVGASAVDITAQSPKPSDKFSTTAGSVSISLGGVGRNMAEASHLLMPSSQRTVLVSPIGNDSFGTLIQEETAKKGMSTDGFLQVDGRTAAVNMFLNHEGNLMHGVADTEITETMPVELVLSEISLLNPSIVGVDGNLSEQTLAAIVKDCGTKKCPVLFEPTSVSKSRRILRAISQSSSNSISTRVAYCTPNLLELAEIYNGAQDEPFNLMESDQWWSTIDRFDLGSQFRLELQQLSRQDASPNGKSRGNLSFLINDGIAQMALHLLPFFQHLVIKCGDTGVFVVARVPSTSSWATEYTNPRERTIILRTKSEELVILRHFPALHVSNIVNVTGAGDSFVGALLAQLSRDVSAFEDPMKLTKTIDLAQQAAVLTLQSNMAVSQDLGQLIKAI